MFSTSTFATNLHFLQSLFVLSIQTTTTMPQTQTNNIATAQFIELLQNKQNIWSHKLPNASTRKKEETTDLAKMLDATGMMNNKK